MEKPKNQILLSVENKRREGEIPCVMLFIVSTRPVVIDVTDHIEAIKRLSSKGDFSTEDLLYVLRQIFNSFENMKIRLIRREILDNTEGTPNKSGTP